MIPRKCSRKARKMPTGSRIAELRCWLVVLSVGQLGCAAAPTPTAREVADANDTGRTLTATSETERKTLAQIANLGDGASRRVGNATVIAEAPYASASGRTCRAVHLTTENPHNTVHRLACSDGQAWFFVPDVFGASPSSPPE